MDNEYNPTPTPPKVKRTGTAKAAKYAAHFAITTRNKTIRIKRHLKKQPNDLQAVEALKKFSS
jgi:hypothetical protein